MMRQIFIGYDSREDEAYRVAEFSFRRRSSVELCITPIRLGVMEGAGLLWRRTDRNMQPGSLWDVLSKKPMSTEFSLSRFLVPHLQLDGWAMFCDCDVVCLGDVDDLFRLADPKYAVMCVKHDHAPENQTKMDGAIQRRYRRKNWSSVVLWNCSHSANKRLTLQMLNSWPRDLLHAFSWLEDSEIGELHAGCNWLVNEQPRPESVMLAHFTNGGPWLRDWQPVPNDDIWLHERDAMRQDYVDDQSRIAAAG